jgi:signal transduction histidine kinase
VTDTGSGIQEEEIDKVFERHFKGSASTGTGIGLSLVKRICDRYDWQAEIASSAGQGTTIRLVFTPLPSAS